MSNQKQIEALRKEQTSVQAISLNQTSQEGESMWHM